MRRDPGTPGGPHPGSPGGPHPGRPRDPRFPGGPPYQGMPYGAGTPGGPQGEVSRKTAQNLLLVLGGLLLAVAAIVFTVVSWGRLGIGGRAAILTGLTVVTLAVPAVLLRRKLNATAETVGVLGLALMLLDGYAAAAAGLIGSVDMWDHTAATIAVVALAAALYARLLPLKVPLPLAVVLAQAPLPMLATGHGRGWPTAALAATVVLNAAVWSVARTRGFA
ncbi:hypothetical protein [Nonomuraea recticatena]|uniref:hypothetical protein n=1 Tax=Nonomuraea recticatena TaxID=46178 RepID=UPI0036123301